MSEIKYPQNNEGSLVSGDEAYKFIVKVTKILGHEVKIGSDGKPVLSNDELKRVLEAVKNKKT